MVSFINLNHSKLEIENEKFKVTHYTKEQKIQNQKEIIQICKECGRSDDDPVIVMLNNELKELMEA